MNEYRLQIKVKNNLILKKIEELGYATVGEFCTNNGMQASVLYDLINFKESPLRKDGTVRVECQKLLDALDCLLQDIFTDDQIFGSLKASYNIELSKEDAQVYLQNINDATPLLENEMAEENFKEKFRNKIKLILKPREHRIIQKWFGIELCDRRFTLEEIAETEDITPERVRQIIAKSLRYLRKKLKEGDLAESLDEDRYGINVDEYERYQNYDHLCY